MTQRQKSLKVGIAAILCALVFRFYSPAMMAPVIRFLTDPETVAFLIYAETGRNVRFSSSGQVEQEIIPAPDLSYNKESVCADLPEWITPVLGDSDLVELSYGCGYRPDVEAMLRQPLTWDLRENGPTVLIYHTHTTESYLRQGRDYEETAPYRTKDPYYNVVSVGERVAAILEQAGITVIHDTEIHDYPEYNTAYMHSRRAMQKLLRENPGILLALDIHRDAQDVPGGQLRTVANVGGRTAAQLMVVVGTNCNLRHDRWPENLALGLKLHAQLEAQTPGIVRPLCLRRQRFNPDLSPGALLIEVGAAGNSQEEALLAADQLAHAIIAISRGTEILPTAGEADSAADPPAAPSSDS